MLGDIFSTTTQLTPNFTLADLTTTNTGLDNTPNQVEEKNLKKLAVALQTLEDTLGPINVASAFRSAVVNAAVGGSSTSRHLFGDAADFSPRLQTAEKYWSMILADPKLKNMFGEISYKKHQGTIHVTLPFYNSFGLLVKGSARVADEDMFGNVTYKSQTPEQITGFFEKHGIVETKFAGLGIGIFVAAIGVLSTIVVIKRRK